MSIAVAADATDLLPTTVTGTGAAPLFEAAAATEGVAVSGAVDLVAVAERAFTALAVVVEAVEAVALALAVAVFITVGCIFASDNRNCGGELRQPGQLCSCSCT